MFKLTTSARMHPDPVGLADVQASPNAVMWLVALTSQLGSDAKLEVN